MRHRLPRGLFLGALAQIVTLAFASPCKDMSASDIDNYYRGPRPTNCPSCSVLIGHGAEIRRAARENGLDPRLLIALTGIESAYGTSNAATTANNPFGLKRLGAAIPYPSLLDAIVFEAATLRQEYVDFGSITPAQIYTRGYCNPKEGECNTDSFVKIYKSKTLGGGGDVNDVRSDCTSQCGDDIADPSEACDGSDRQSCATMCLPDCTCAQCTTNADCNSPCLACVSGTCVDNCLGDCKRCRNGACVDIRPPDNVVRWAVVVSEDPLQGCTCDAGGCACTAGADMNFNYFKCFAEASTVPQVCCGAQRTTSSRPPVCPPQSPTCDPFVLMGFVWTDTLGCRLTCTNPFVSPCLSPDIGHQYHDPPPLGTVVDLRTADEKASNCCRPPGANACLSASCCGGP